MGTHVINERAIRVEAKPKALKRRDSAKTDGQIILVEDEVAVFSSPRVASVARLTPHLRRRFAIVSGIGTPG